MAQTGRPAFGVSTIYLSTIERDSDLFCDAIVLWFSKEAKRFFTAFPTHAALFHASERNAAIPDEPAIHPDGAGVDSLGDAMGAAQVLGPNAGREAIFDIIGVIDHFFFAVERRNCYDGAKNFFAICAA